jgi:uncharacterized protein YjbI with pentapeptide repeats
MNTVNLIQLLGSRKKRQSWNLFCLENNIPLSFFEGKDLSSLDSLPLNLTDGRFSKSDFSYAQARRCDFRGADFTQARLYSGHFEDGIFTKSTLDGVHANGASFMGAFLKGVSATGSSFRQASLSQTNMGNSCWNRVNFSDAFLPLAHINSCEVEGAIFDRASLYGATLIELKGKSSFRNANLSWVRWCVKNSLASSDFFGASFVQARIEQSDFSLCDFRRSNCTFAEFEEVDLKGADFRSAICKNTSFRCSDLAGADFTGAVLTDVDFDGANLEGVKF